MAAYADKIFDLLGDKVKYWLTINEPSTYCSASYGPDARLAPEYLGTEQDVYNCVHYVILSHASAAHSLKKRYPKGQISIPLVDNWNEPATNTQTDRDAADRSQFRELAYYADPIISGDYPAELKADPRINRYLPKFTDAQKKFVRNTVDFFGLNYYTARWAYNDPDSPLNVSTDPINPVTQQPIGPQADVDWLYVYPQGIRKLVNWIHNRYTRLPVWITENGVAAPGEGNPNATLSQIINDTFRVNYFRDHLNQLRLAVVENKVPLKAYMAWTLLDNFEWRDTFWRITFQGRRWTAREGRMY